MSYRSTIINGALRYRAAKALELVLGGSRIQSCEALPTAGSQLRRNPCFLSLPAIALPAQLDAAAINYLRENSLSSPKAIEDRAELLSTFLWSRSLINETEILEKVPRTNKLRVSQDEDDESNDELQNVLQTQQVQHSVKDRPSASGRLKESALAEWKSLTYSGHNCELYLTARLAPNFAAACRVLYEIRKRCPRFFPRNLFDFGSGLGTIAWAANSVWPVGCIREHYLVEPSADMTKISEFMFRKNMTIQSPETVFPGIYLRRFTPASMRSYDLVVSAYTLFELPGVRARRQMLSNMWDRTSSFLVLIEQGTKAGFNAILEARQWLLENGGDSMFLFAPCPHSFSCGKADSACNISVQYYKFALTRDDSEPKTELVSYLIASRGDWRRYQSPVVEAESQFLPRLVTYGVSSEESVVHDICLPSGAIERTAFPKKQSAKALYYFLRHAKMGDILPCEPQVDPLPTSEGGD
ncbi:unnamed protein product [Dicrocoelium dendriticum]|nr:unnamed protein product [Dicrocoelium dendriticum]